MRSVRLPYGDGTLPIEVPDSARVLVPTDPPALGDPAEAIVSALWRPRIGPGLPDLVTPRASVVVVFPDITRPMPNRIVLPPLLGALRELGAGPDEVTLLCSTGTHRSATAEEMEALVGSEIASTYRVDQHVATDGDHVEVGVVEGAPVLLDRRYVEADLRIVTGFVEPHFFAGFSGGPKAVVPGVAALETILEAHSPARILSEEATWLELDANPVHRFVSAATGLLPPQLSLDVTIDRARALTGVYVGPLPGAHREACAFVERTAVLRVPEPADIVVTSNAGLPLDRNLYQAVKGMAAAERVVRPGGDIVMVASCIDGYPDDGPFATIVQRASPGELTDREAVPAQDLWQAEVLGRVLAKADVHLFTEGLTPEQVRAVHLDPVDDPAAALSQLLDRRPKASVCVLPEGPLTVATVAS